MRSTNLFAFASLLGLAGLFATGCTPIRLGDDSSGDLGTSRFEYQSSDCLLGCSLDRPALEGSKITIVAHGGDVDKSPTARLATGVTGAISSQSNSCTCAIHSDNGTTSRGIDPAQKCATTETKSCQLSIDIDTTKAGDDTLEILEPTGELRDRVVFHVRLAKTIELTVRADDATLTPGSDGAFVVKRGAQIALQSKVLADDGQEMIFTQHGVAHVYGDRSVLQPDDKTLFGATDVEYVATGRAGDTMITVTAPGAETVALFHVVN